MPAKVYTEKDADLRVIKNKTLAVIGFGSQGHAHALNLKESGMTVLVGLYKGSKSIPVAQKLGFEVVEVAEAVKRADVIMLAVPDMKQKAVYTTEIEPNLTKGKTLVFIHGFTVHYGPHCAGPVPGGQGGSCPYRSAEGVGQERQGYRPGMGQGNRVRAGRCHSNLLP